MPSDSTYYFNCKECGANSLIPVGNLRCPNCNKYEGETATQEFLEAEKREKDV